MNGPSNANQMPLRWALILLLAGLATAVVGGLTVVQSGSWPAALLAGLAAGGATVLGANQIAPLGGG
jgi:hypothetical protein